MRKILTRKVLKVLITLDLSQPNLTCPELRSLCNTPAEGCQDHSEPYIYVNDFSRGAKLTTYLFSESTIEEALSRRPTQQYKVRSSVTLETCSTWALKKLTQP